RHELEAATTALGDARANILGHIAHMVHGVVGAHGAGVLGLDEFHLYLTEVHKGVAPTPSGRPATHVHPVELVHVPGYGLRRVAHQVPGVNDLVDLDSLTYADGIGLGRQLGQVDQYAVGRVGIKVEDLLPQGVGEGCVRDKRETPG